MAKQEDDNRPIPGTFRLVCPTPPGTDLATKWIAKEPETDAMLVWTEKFEEAFTFHEYEKAKNWATFINDGDGLDKVVVQGKGTPLVDQPEAERYKPAMQQELAAWILSVLIAIGGTREWKASYPETADAMAAEAVSGPLFAGDAAEYRTAALEIAVAEKEGGFNPKAINTSGGRQLCFFQVHEVNRKFLGLKDAEELYEPKTCVRAGMILMRRSFDFCRARKRLESWFLAQYASGRESCDYGVDASRERMGLGEWIFGRYASDP